MFPTVATGNFVAILAVRHVVESHGFGLSVVGLFILGAPQRGWASKTTTTKGTSLMRLQVSKENGSSGLLAYVVTGVADALGLPSVDIKCKDSVWFRNFLGRSIHTPYHFAVSQQ